MKKMKKMVLGAVVAALGLMAFGEEFVANGGFETDAWISPSAGLLGYMREGYSSVGSWACIEGEVGLCKKGSWAIAAGVANMSGSYAMFIQASKDNHSSTVRQTVARYYPAGTYGFSYKLQRRDYGDEPTVNFQLYPASSSQSVITLSTHAATENMRNNFVTISGTFTISPEQAGSYSPQFHSYETSGDHTAVVDDVSICAYVVSFDAQGGAGGMTSVEATSGAAMPAITVPTKLGYTFAGYFDATEGGTKYYNADGTSAKAWDKTEDTTLYAQWNFAVMEITDEYRPTQIVNGDFSTEPWMDYTYNGKRYTQCPNVKGEYEVGNIAFHGVDGGWNTTETKTYDSSLFEYACRESGTHSVEHNPSISRLDKYIEMNCQNPAILYQDLSTHEGDVVRWSLKHAVRTGDTPDQTQSMRVEIGSPLRDSGGAIVNASGTWSNIDSKISSNGKALFRSNGVTDAQGAVSTIGFAGSDIANLSLDKTNNVNGWWTASGVYIVPDGQTVTRFGFVSEAKNVPNWGNLLDDVVFSTLMGNLRLTDNGDGSATITGFWGDDNPEKLLAIEIGEKTYYASMGNVLNKSFSFVLSAEQIGNAREVTVYHEDYPSAAKTVALTAIVPIGGDVNVKVDAEWLEKKGLKDKTVEEIAEEMKKVDPGTGMKVWQNYVLGDTNARPVIKSAEKDATDDGIVLGVPSYTVNTKSGLTATRKLILQRTASSEAEKTSDLALDATKIEVDKTDVSAANPVALYKTVIEFSNGESVKSENLVGVMYVKPDAQKAIVAVPWEQIGGGAISAADLIDTRDLTDGDKLHVYDKAKSQYKSWTLTGGAWAPLGTYKIEAGKVSATSAGDPGEATIARGDGVWLERGNTEKPFHLIGQYNAEKVTLPDAAGWNICGNAGLEAAEVAGLGAGDGDIIIVPTAAEPVRYTKKDGEWGSYVETVTEVKGRKVKTSKWQEGGTVGIGQGFWVVKPEAED